MTMTDAWATHDAAMAETKTRMAALYREACEQYPEGAMGAHEPYTLFAGESPRSRKLRVCTVAYEPTVRATRFSPWDEGPTRSQDFDSVADAVAWLREGRCAICATAPATIDATRDHEAVRVCAECYEYETGASPEGA